ncbi:hypothetical protein MMC30_007223 [Trapelia coarctata]|nr:hypothetical protein [Trapelia coarctata]
MAGNSQGQSDAADHLLRSLATQSNTGRSFHVDGSTTFQPHPFEFMNSSIQARSSESPQLNSLSASMHQAFHGYNQRPSGATTPNANATTSRSSMPNPLEQSGVDRTANLLNLLNFTQTTSSRGSTAQPVQAHTTYAEQSDIQPSSEPTPMHPTHARGLSASDLVGTSMGRPSSSMSREDMSSSSPATKAVGKPVPPAVNPQDFLLQLLSRPKNTNASPPVASTQSHSQVQNASSQQAGDATLDKLARDLSDTSLQKGHQAQAMNTAQGGIVRHESPIRVFGSSDIKDTTPFEPQVISKVEPAKEPSMFTYVNPFEQLAASSPRNVKARSGTATPQKALLKAGHAVAHAEGSKRKTNDPSPAPASSATRRKLTQDGHDVLESIETHAHGGLGAPTTNPETVAEALNEVGAQVSKQVDHALAQASNTEDDSKIKREENDSEEKAVLDALEEGLHKAAIKAKADLEKPENQGALDETYPKGVAEAVKEVIDEAAEGDIAGVRGSTEDEKSSVEANASPAIAVYNFPMRPFVCIDIKQDHLPTHQLRDDVVIQIARLKKEFDQIDRTLATASSTFILYAMPKAGGLRIIRQDDGLDRQVFKETHDRIFNVALSTAASGSALKDVQTVIATAVSGNVYWATICQSSSDIIGVANIESNVLVFPPVPAQDENTSGGQLKTRAKKSSRHPEFFAIGRGKSIQIVFPTHAQNSTFVSTNAVVETTGYFKDRGLKINTGKAGKDFTFSEDDTMITTLDKAGRLRFWDVRDLVHESNGTASKIAPIEINTPILSFSTVVANEKSWPTSVLFVDKIRPYNKGTALRYLIVGMKQNHTLQLWDLGLGKVVQELSFPHEKESDAICSVCYHPGSGIIVVGHPTRNSIYFIHLSAPKYNLPGMSQSAYVKRLASKDPNLRTPDATAIMSGMREYSFSAKGQLRSIDLLSSSSDSPKGSNNEEEPCLFELYVMHSKGVTCLSIKKEDLGWSQDTKVMNPLDAELHSVIEVRALRETQPTVQSEMSSVNGDSLPVASSQPEQALKGDKKESSKTSSKARKAKLTKSIEANGESSALEKLPTSGPSNGVERSKPSFRANAIPSGSELGRISPLNQTLPGSYAAAALQAAPPSSRGPATSDKEAKKSSLSKSESVDAPKVDLGPEHQQQPRRSLADAESISLGVSSDFLNKELKKLEKVVSDEFSNVLGRELGSLYRRIDTDRRVQDAAGAAKQDAMLRLVSSTLTDNVDKALARIINTNIQQVVLPYMTDAMISTLNDKLPGLITQQLLHTLPAQLKLALPEAVSKAIQTQDVLRVLSDQVTAKIANQVEKQFTTVLHQTIAPAFQNLAVGAAQRMNAETERRVAEQLNQVTVQHREDTVKIDQLRNAVHQLTETLHAMAGAQTVFQNRFLADQQQAVQQQAIQRQAIQQQTTQQQAIQEQAIQEQAVQQRAIQHRRDSMRDTPRDPPRETTREIATRESSEDRGRGGFDRLALMAPDGVVFTPEQQSLREVMALVREGKYEEATVHWLQTRDQAFVFNRFFYSANPAYIKECQPLVVLSTGAAVTQSFDTYPEERLNWLQVVLDSINPAEPEIGTVGPKLMEVLSQRLHAYYMHLAESDQGNPIINRIPGLARKAQELAARAEWADNQGPIQGAIQGPNHGA